MYRQVRIDKYAQKCIYRQNNRQESVDKQTLTNVYRHVLVDNYLQKSVCRQICICKYLYMCIDKYRHEQTRLDKYRMNKYREEQTGIEQYRQEYAEISPYTFLQNAKRKRLAKFKLN